MYRSIKVVFSILSWLNIIHENLQALKSCYFEYEYYDRLEFQYIIVVHNFGHYPRTG